MKKQLKTVLFFILITASFYLFIGSFAYLTEGIYIDMSGNNRYSLSQETKESISKLEQQQQIRIYKSSQIAQNYPQTEEYASYVTEYLNQYAKESNGKIKIEVINIEPFSEQEQEASKYGLKEFLSKDGKINLYFGGVLSNENGDFMVIPNFVEMRRPYLEYDITSAITHLNSSDKKTKIGLIAPDINLKIDTQGKLDFQNNLNIFNQLSRIYDIIPISDYAVQISVDINTLILVNPNNGLSRVGQYALDQFLLRGGNLIVFLDSVNEKTNRINDDQKIKNLLNNWGINFSSQETIGSKDYAVEIITSSKSFIYEPWMTLSQKSFNPKHRISSGINRIGMRSPTAIEKYKAPTSKEFIPLISLQGETGSIKSTDAQTTYKEVAAQKFKITEKEYILAATSEGEARSIFTDNIMKGTKYETQMLPFLPKSIKKGKIVVIGDIDFLYDDTWSDNTYKNKNPIYGIVPWNDNGFFLEKIINDLTEQNSLATFKIIPFMPQDSLGIKYKKNIEKNLSTEKEQKEKEIQDAIKQAQTINYEKTGMESIKTINQLQEKITTAEKGLREIEYKAERFYQSKIQQFMILSLLFISLYGMIVVIFINKKYQKRRLYNSGE